MNLWYQTLWLAAGGLATAQTNSTERIFPLPGLPRPNQYDLVRVTQPGEYVAAWPLGGGFGVDVINHSASGKVRLFAEYRNEQAFPGWHPSLQAIVVDDGSVAEIWCDEVLGDIDVFIGKCAEVRFWSLPSGSPAHAAVYVDDGAIVSIPDSQECGSGNHIWIKDTRITTIHTTSYAEEFIVGNVGPALTVRTGRPHSAPSPTTSTAPGCALDFTWTPGESGDSWDLANPDEGYLANGVQFRNSSAGSSASMQACFVPSAEQFPEQPPTQMTLVSLDLSDGLVGEASVYGTKLQGDAWPIIVHGTGMTVALNYSVSAEGQTRPPQQLRAGNVYTLGVGMESCLWDLPDGTRLGHTYLWPTPHGALQHNGVLFRVP